MCVNRNIVKHCDKASTSTILGSSTSTFFWNLISSIYVQILGEISLHNEFQGSLKTRTTDILFFHISYNISNNWTWVLQMLFYGWNLLLFHISSCWFMIVSTDNRNNKCPHWGLNSRPSVYKTDTLPLSYTGIILLIT